MSSSTTTRPALEVADILRTHGPAFLEQHGDHLSADQRRVLHELALCRTGKLGGHAEQCLDCGHPHLAYNSCRNRHCPKCHAQAKALWLTREASTLLPAEYHHVVFTLPQALGPLALQNPRLLYRLLFHTAWDTVQQLAVDPRYLGGQVGLLAVLHTWGQTLCHHPHLHCVVSGGGLACTQDGQLQQPHEWRACRPGFFLPVRVLSRLFRGKFLAGVRAAYAAGRLGLHGRLATLANPAAFTAWLTPLYEQEWVVYAKPPAAGPEVVLKYLARYVYGVAISNFRLVDLADGKVTFRYKDYADANRERHLTLSADEFIRRFLQHVLPKGFTKVRHYGLLANRYREPQLEICRRLLFVVTVVTPPPSATTPPLAAAPQPRRCPVCGGQAWLLVVSVPRPKIWELYNLPLTIDSG